MEPKLPAQRVAQKVYLTQEALEFVTNTDLISIIMNDGYEVESFVQALAHVSFGNPKLTKVICKLALNAISASGGPSDFSRVSNHLQIVKS